MPRRTVALLSRLVPFVVAAIGFVAVWGTVRAGLAWMPLLFAYWDDEGFFMQALQGVLDGSPLYDDTYAQYGPFYYLVAATVHRVTGLPVTHDGSRLAMLVLWLIAAATTSWAVGRLTRSLGWAIVTLVLLAAHLPPSGSAPGLVQWLAQVMVSAAILLSTMVRYPARRQTLVLVGIGTLAACVFFTKINIGTYLVIGLGLALLSAARRTRLTSGLFAIGAAAGAGLPFIVMHDHLADGAFEYALVTSMAIVACSTIAWGRQDRDGEEIPPVAIPLVAGSFLAAGASICGLTLLAGTSVGGLVRGMVVWPLQLAGVMFLPPRFLEGTVAVSILSGLIGIGLVAWARWSRDTHRVERVVTVLRWFIGSLAVYAWFYRAHAFRSWAVAFVWIILFQPSRAPSRDEQGLGRTTLAFVAATAFLDGYPVAGGEMDYATYLLVAVLVVCLADMLRAATWSELDAHPVGRFATSVAAMAALAFFVRLSIPRLMPPPLQAGLERLDQPGARLIREGLPGEAARTHWITANLRAHCDTFISRPGFNSYYFWTGLKPPTGLNAGGWMIFLDKQQQQRVVAALERYHRPCAVRDRAAERFWLRGLSIPVSTILERPLARYIEQHFVPVATGFGREFMLPRSTPMPPFENFLLFGDRRFDGTGAFPTPVEALADPRPRTVGAWFRTGQAGVILACQRAEGFPPSVVESNPILYVGHDGRLRGQIGGDPRHVIATAQDVADDRWHNVSLVVAPGEQALYVDGAIVGSIAGRPDSVAQSSCQIGSGFTRGWPSAGDGWMPFRGEVMDVSVVDVALSDADIRTRAAGPVHGRASGGGASPGSQIAKP